MPTLVRNALITIVVIAATLAVADWLFDGMSVSPRWYVITVIVFAALNIAIRAAVSTLTPKLIRVSTIAGGLVVTFAALWLTNLVVPDKHFVINGWGTWIGVTAMIWAAGIAYGPVDKTAPAGVPGASA